MQKSNLPQGLRTLQKWYTTKNLRFDLPIQRAAGQWSPLQKSLLLHSILADFPVPPLYFIKYKGENYVISQHIMEILGDVLEWYCACPDLDMVFVMHDYYPDDVEHLDFQYAFHIKDRVIKMVNSYDAEKLYKEYNEKYPIDLKDVEEWIEYMKS